MKLRNILFTATWCTVTLLARLPQNVPATRLPAGITVADWSQIHSEYERHRHGFFPEGNGLVARSFEQQWLATFDGRGFTVKPDEGAWSWGLEVAGVTGKAQIKRDVNRLTYRWNANLDEWFLNDTRGLEHGFTLRAPQEIRLSVRGGLQAQMRGRVVEFVDASGTARMRYSGLKAWDADGISVPARMYVEGGMVRLAVDDRGARYPLTIDPIAQQAYLKASNTGAEDFFGHTVATTGDTVVVGAYGEDSGAAGVNANQADNSAADSGAIYVFVRSGTTWTQQAYIKSSNPATLDYFGSALSISGDTIAAGAFGEDSSATGVNGNQADNNAGSSGAVYIFVRSGTTWTQQAYLKSSNTGSGDWFGTSVSIVGDTLAVGAQGEDSSATGANGTQTNNGTLESGAVYVFVRNAGNWTQQAYLKSSNTGQSDFFGYSVSLSGESLVVGAYGESSNATGVNGNQADDSAGGSGAAYVFTRAGAAWTQQAYLKASNTGPVDYFGSAVAISGDTVVVGAFGEDSAARGVNGSQSDNSASASGAAYVFLRSGSTWAQQAYLKAANADAGDWFGTSVAISGNVAAVGAYLESGGATGVNGNSADNSAQYAGAAYVFERSGATWTQQSYVKASNTDIGDQFGLAIAFGGDTMVVGAYQENGGSTGVNGNQADNSVSNSSAAYVFTGVTGGMSIAATGPLAVAGATQTLVFRYTHSNGFGQLGVVNALINQYLDGNAACYIAFSQPLNVLYLVNDLGPGSGISAGLTLGGAGSVSNSQCTINAAGSSAVSSGTTLTLTLNVTYKTPFLGNKVIYLAAQDQAGNSTGWKTVGATIVPETAPTFPRANAMSPSTGTTSTATISFTYLDAAAAGNLQTAWALINNAIDGRQACYVAYYAPGNTLYLYPDNGDGTQATSIVLTGANTIENSQCRISAQGSSVSTSGGQLTVNLNYTFKAPFAGNRAIWTAVQTLGGAQTSAWKPVGGWLVP